MDRGARCVWLQAMFEDKAFEIDEKSEEYRLLHPNADSNK